MLWSLAYLDPIDNVARMIVKLQRPVHPPDGPVLAYDQRREHQKTLPLTPKLTKLFGDQFKIFVDAELSPAGELEIGKRVPDRGW
jgi:hypothetical protein